MNQLKMKRNNSPIAAASFPEGFYMRAYQPGDGVGWCKCCIDGKLGVDELSEDVFARIMLNDKTVNPANIFFLISPTNEIAGSVTYQYSPKSDTGTIHMVGIEKSYRGMRLSLPMMLYAMQKILGDGKTTIDLSTDDWRLPAIKTYFNAWFEPDYYSDDMEERWQRVREQL